MPGITAVIFDMYETLAQNNTSLWLRTFDKICRKQDLPLTGEELWHEWKLLEVRFRKERYDPGYPFKSYEQAWRECFENVFSKLGKGDAIAAARASVIALGQRDLFPETFNMITRLKEAKHLRRGILSNSDNGSLWPLLKRHGLQFDATVCSEAALAYKPDPHVFSVISSALNVPAKLCLFVGDSQYDDVQGAHKVGMQTVWVNRQGMPPDPALPLPDYQVADLYGVLEILGIYSA
ncbi:HAD family hydrolase [Dehalococcoidia bacterium]|nr:HAD family hydrolase [Dehalococcoidia bacterium]